MDVLVSIAQWLANNLFGVPAFLLMCIVLVGHLVQKSPIEKVVTGTVKAIIGFLIINAGAGVIVGALNVFQPLWAEVFGLKATALSNFMGYDAFNTKFGSTIALIMTFGFLVNVLLARITKFKYIYLTGHMMWWTTAIFAGVILNFAPNMPTWLLMCILVPVMGLYWTLQPALTQKYVRIITGGNEIALGHTVAIGAWLSALVGKVLGNKSKDAEDMKFSTRLSFLRDNNVVTALVMILFFVVGAIIIMTKNTEGSQALVKAAGTQNFIIYAIIQSLTFAAGIAVVLVGVRMFIGEIVPAFKGISTKIVPNAVPALDCPVLFTYSPNAVILGFIGAFFGGVIWMAILGLSVGYVFVPTMIVLFFHGATAGIFGNATGGRRGAIIGGFIIATIVAVGQWICVTFLISSTIPDTAMWAADTDMFIVGPVVALIAKLFAGI